MWPRRCHPLMHERMAPPVARCWRGSARWLEVMARLPAWAAGGDRQAGPRVRAPGRGRGHRAPPEDQAQCGGCRSHDRVLPTGPGPSHGDHARPPAAGTTRSPLGQPGTAGPGSWAAGPCPGLPRTQTRTSPDQTAAEGPAVPDPPAAARPPTARVRPAEACTRARSAG